MEIFCAMTAVWLRPADVFVKADLTTHFRWVRVPCGIYTSMITATTTSMTKMTMGMKPSVVSLRDHSFIPHVLWRPWRCLLFRAHRVWGMVWILYIQSLVLKTCPELVGVYLSIHLSSLAHQPLSLSLSPASPFFFFSCFSAPPPNFFCNLWHLSPVVSGPFRASGMRQCDVSAFLRRVKQGEDRFISQRLHGLSNDQKAQWHPGSDALSVTDFSRFWPPVHLPEPAAEAAAGPHCMGHIQEGTEPAS